MNLRSRWQTSALVFALAAVSLPVHSQTGASPNVPAQALKAKTDYCKTCHGIEGQGFRGSFPMPRLAGQQPEYLANQLQAFIDRRRTNPVMFNVAHVLDPEMVKALAAYFKNLNPKPLGGGPKSSPARGQEDLRGRRAERQCPALRVLPWR